ncbi:hypothetical protein KCV26_15205 [Petrimonas sulfuriphila]|jgi:hypothetical protein|uniref:NVEALA domain-containing protein n=1 Tax=Petrimonas sulfuriphila TaxID=285070 RepID=UPI00324E8893
MRKKILSGVFALALLATAGLGVHKSMKSDTNLNDLALANVEALAYGEGSPNLECSTLCSDEWCGTVVIDGHYFYLQHCVFV